MSRLESEYDPAAHHDLAVVDLAPVTGYPQHGLYGWVCACGERSVRFDWKTIRGARNAHERHREEVGR